MYVRITTVTGASDIEGGLDALRDQVVPEMRQQKGFGGLSASGDRSAGTVKVLALWETAADMEASESAADKSRGEAVRRMGGQVTVERFEQTYWEIADTPPSPGMRLHIRHIRMDPARIDEHQAYFRDNVVPEIKASPGFRAVRALIDRSTGEGRVSVVWADEDSLKAWLADSDRRRAVASGRGVEFGEDEFLEVLFGAFPS